jgi:hypothetical protein
MPKEFVIYCPRLMIDDFDDTVARLPDAQAQVASDAIDMFLWVFRDVDGRFPRIDVSGGPRVLLQPTRGSFTSGGVRIDFVCDRTLDPSPVVVLSISVARPSP